MRRRDFLGALGSGLGAAFLPPYPPVVLPTSARSPVRPSGCFVERWSWAMGQPVHLQLFAESESHGYDAAAAALAELRRVESRLTLFDDASDLAELNRHAGRRGGIRVDRDLASVLAAALDLERATRGGFNPAVEPLMRAWGFHAARRTEPSPAEIREAREAVTAARIELNDDRVTVPQSATRLDLGGIGVGYGLDQAAAVLRLLGIRSALIDVSGDCIAIGTPPGRPDGWAVDIADPTASGGVRASTRLRDAALATSANTMSVVRYGREVRGHVMNPETGWPADALLQVSVMARTGTEADALSTGMLVSGKAVGGALWYTTVKSEE